VGLRKRSFTIARHRTSVALEAAFWDMLERIAAQRDVPLAALVAEIDAAKSGGLASALRVFALREALTSTGAKDGAAAGAKEGPQGTKPLRPKSGESN
jgi:predicted DNA-binding ribbon-helix-helix protein